MFDFIMYADNTTLSLSTTMEITIRNSACLTTSNILNKVNS